MGQLHDPNSPIETEAEEQAEETVMPWVWGGIAFIAIVAFIVWLVVWPSLHQSPHPPAAAPLTHPPSQQTP